MVTFEKEKEDERCITFLYYPEGDRECPPGIITFDKREKKLEIAEIAPNDFERDILPEEDNMLVNAINSMKDENDPECVVPTNEPMHVVWYGDHAVSEIHRWLKKGVVPDKGMKMWY